MGELRRAGLPVSLTEAVDASEAVAHIPLEDREALKYALAATLVKSAHHWGAFDTAFEVYFSARAPVAGRASAVQDGPAAGGGRPQPGEVARLEELLALALSSGERATLLAVARLAVDLYAGMEPGRFAGGAYYRFRTLSALDPEGALTRLLAGGQAVAPPGPGPGDAGGALERRLVEDDYRGRLEELHKLVEAEIRRRLVAQRGAAEVASHLRSPLVEDVEFMHATGEEMALMRQAMAPLARKLRARLARRRRHMRHGSLDFRATMRHSLAYGGVPAEPRFKHPHPSKPEIFVLADVSGSVAAFARFTLELVHAISSEFSKVRSFVFIDNLDEVTHIFEEAESLAEAVQRVNQEADVVFVDGHSDYGHALGVFEERYGAEVGPRTSLIVTGDARSNYHRPEASLVRGLRQRARHFYWLNPEPRAYWGSGDSVIEQYAPFLDGVYECRNLRQLSAFVEHLS